MEIAEKRTFSSLFLLDRESRYDLDYIEFGHVDVSKDLLEKLKREGFPPNGGLEAHTESGHEGCTYKINTYPLGGEFRILVTAPISPPQYPPDRELACLNFDTRYRRSVKTIDEALQLHFDLLNYFNTHKEQITHISPSRGEQIITPFPRDFFKP